MLIAAGVKYSRHMFPFERKVPQQKLLLWDLAQKFQKIVLMKAISLSAHFIPVEMQHQCAEEMLGYYFCGRLDGTHSGMFWSGLYSQPLSGNLNVNLLMRVVTIL